METYRIEILNPKAKSLLKNLADMNLTRLKKEKKKAELSDMLSKLRENSENAISAEEISKEVEKVRSSHYEKDKSSF